jgi:Zn-dependent protease
MDFSPEQIRNIVQGLAFLVASIALHEFGHAIAADKLGDSLPRRQGRITLNPMAHSDPIGTLAFPLLGLLASKGMGMGFGWGKPVMVRPTHFTRKLRQRTAHMLVAAAGPAMNVLLGVVVSTLHLVFLKLGWVAWGSAVSNGFVAASMLNFGLALFNCIPAPPLDGGTIVEGFLPQRYLPGYRKYSVYGPFVLLAFIMIKPFRQALGNATLWLYEHWGNLIGLFPSAIA